MLRLILALVLLALVGLMVAGRLGDWRRQRAAVAEVSPRPSNAVVTGAAGTGRLLDSVTRLSARVQLTADPARQYLDSLLLVTDSTIRHWPVAAPPIWYALVPGGSPDYAPEMPGEVRAALDAWSPVALGLRLLETDDTSHAALVVGWTTTLPGRAGVTNLTWDRGGDILRARVTLATRDPQSGQLLGPEGRRAVALHELGHALGLPHSPEPADAMHPVTVTDRPTDRDLTSLRLLYSLPSGWIGAGPRPPPRP